MRTHVLASSTRAWTSAFCFRRTDQQIAVCLLPELLGSCLLALLCFLLLPGVDRHIIYVEDGVEELAAEPRLVELVRSGRVELVAWREMPRVLRPGTSERHPYANQVGG